MAIIKVANRAIDLDAAEIPNLDASKITSGTFADARLSASSVTQHSTPFDDNKLVNDISTLALRQASDENKSAYNTNSSSVDVFQDETGIDTKTNVLRNASEYMSARANVNDANTLELLFADDLTTGDFTGKEVVGERGLLKIIEASNAGQDVTSDTPFTGGKSWESGQWENGSSVYGFYLRTVSGQTSPLNFGTGAYTIEGFVRLSNTGYTTAHQYIIDFATAENINRTTIAPYNTEAQTAYSGSFLPYNAGTNFYSWGNFDTGSFRHFAYVRDASGNHAVFINGTRVINSSSTDSTALNYADSNYLGILQRHNGENSSFMKMADLRISDVARYDPTLTSCTVPSSRFSLTSEGISATGNFTGTTITAPSSVSSMGAIITYQDNAGTNALNTDIVLKLSADNGSNYSTATLTAMPDFSSGIKMAKVNDLSVTAGTQLKYKIEFANQSASKEARIRGVSLQY